MLLKSDDWSSCKDDYMWNHSTCDCDCNKGCKIDKYFDIKDCSCVKPLIGKLVSECKDEILNTTEILIDNKKIICEKSNYLIHTTSLLIKCLLSLIVVFISCYFHFTKHRLKQKHLLSYHDFNNKEFKINNII